MGNSEGHQLSQEVATEFKLRELKGRFEELNIDAAGDEISRSNAAEQFATEIENNEGILAQSLKAKDNYLSAIDVLHSAIFIPRLENFLIRFTEKNSNDIIEGAIKGGKEAKNKMFKLLGKGIIVSENLRLRNGQSFPNKTMATILDALDQHRGDLLKDEEAFRSYFYILLDVGNGGSKVHRDNLRKSILDLYDNQDIATKKEALQIIKTYFIFSYGKKHMWDEVEPVVKRLTYDLNKYTLDKEEDIISNVVFNGPGGTNQDNMLIRLAENIDAALTLEKQRPGICKVLRKEFGIRSFFRYPPEILIAQYDSKKSNTRRGILITAVSDSSGASYSDTVKKAIGGLFKQLQNEKELGEKYGLMVYEAGNNRELMRAIVNARNNSPTKRLQFGIIQGHGQADSVRLGGRLEGNKKTEFLTSEILTSPLASSIAAVFEQGAPIILNSCSTGKEIVEKVAKLGLKVSGPLTSDSIRSFFVSVKEGKLNIEAQWKRDKVTYHGSTEVIV